MKSIKVFFVSVAALLITFTMAGCGESNIKTEPGDTGIKIIKSGFHPAQKVRDDHSVECTDDRSLACPFVVQNASTDTAYDGARLVVTAYDKDGDVLVTEKCLIDIQPEEKQAGLLQIECNVEEVDNVKFKIEPGKKTAPSKDEVKSSDFKISGTKEHESDDYTVVTGKVKSKYSFEQVYITVLFEKKGKIVFSAGTFVKDIAAGQEKEFKSNNYLVPEHDSYEVFADGI